jgi:23S rRNA pseudouridine2605 synthase/16S rRNA pseudouridine516 synthase
VQGQQPVRGERLQKILARAGIASRRAAEQLIAQGRVRVNGEVVTAMGVRADPYTDRIEVDGRLIRPPAPTPDAEHPHRQGQGQGQGQEMVYILLNKPAGVVSTVKDTHGRPTVVDLVRGAAVGATTTVARRQHTPAPGPRVYPVGRLDEDTTGLLLLTNDGELTFRLTHPRYGVEKEYLALVRGQPGEEALQKLREGVEIEGRPTAPAKVEVAGVQDNDTWLDITIHEGRKRQVRLMCAAVGHPVIQLHRVRFGPLTIGNLQPGKWRYLATHEVHALKRAVGLMRK